MAREEQYARMSRCSGVLPCDVLSLTAGTSETLALPEAH